MPPTSRASRCPSAAHGSNQDALTRLYDVRLSAMNNPASRYGSTVKRAMDSLAKCKTHVTTRKEAMELKYVGAALAKIIVLAPPVVTNSSNSKSDTSANSTNTSRSTTNNSIASKRKRPTTLGSGPTTITTQQPQPIKPQISAKQIAYDKAVAHAQSLQFPDNAKWKVILLIDGREQKADHVQAKLQMSGLPCEQRHLPIGDMAWIAQCTTQISSTTNTGGAKNNCIEVMLGTIIERKAVDDLASSLFGTRYLEQRLRLQHSGLTQVLLLVEGNLNSVHNCSGNTLRMAMMETRVHLGFQVVETKHLDDTVRFLKRIHRRLLQRTFPEAFGGDVETSLPSFQSPDAARRRRHRRKTAKVSLADMVMDTSPRPPQGPKTCIDSNNNNRFMTYAELKAKIERDREAGTKTLGAIHKAMLKQIPTFSHKKVSAIGFAYPTPCALMKAYIGLNQEDGKTLVQDLSTNHGSQRTCRIGPKSAAELYTMCTAGACSNDDHHYDNNDTVLNDDYACGLVSEGIPTVHANVTTKSANTPTRSNVDASSCAIATTQQAIEGTTLKRSPHYVSMPNTKPSTANTPVRTSPSVSPHPSGFSPSSSYNTTDTLGRVANCVEDPPYFNLVRTILHQWMSRSSFCVVFSPWESVSSCLAWSYLVCPPSGRHHVRTRVIARGRRLHTTVHPICTDQTVSNLFDLKSGDFVGRWLRGSYST